MNDSQHTPGPWTLEDQDGCFVDVSGKDWGGFAQVCVKMEDDDANKPEGEANAKLIGISPAMWDLIAETGDAIADVFEQLLRGNWVDDHGHRVNQNSAMAILKDRLNDAIALRAPLIDMEDDAPVGIAEDMKARIDAMSRIQMARIWRFAKTGDPLLQPPNGDYFAKRFKSLGGFSPEISKQIGW